MVRRDSMNNLRRRSRISKKRKTKKIRKKKSRIGVTKKKNLRRGSSGRRVKRGKSKGGGRVRIHHPQQIHELLLQLMDPGEVAEILARDYANLEELMETITDATFAAEIYATEVADHYRYEKCRRNTESIIDRLRKAINPNPY